MTNTEIRNGKYIDSASKAIFWAKMECCVNKKENEVCR